MELVVFEDTDGDGVAEHVDTQLLDSGISTYSMDLQGSKESDFWVQTISDTPDPDVTPTPSIDLVYIGEDVDIVEIYDDFSGGLDENLWIDKSATDDAEIYVDSGNLVLEHGPDSGDRPVVQVNEDFGDPSGGYIDIDVSFEAQKEEEGGQVTFYVWWEGTEHRGSHNVPGNYLSFTNDHNNTLAIRMHDGDTGITFDSKSVDPSTSWHDYRFVLKGNRDRLFALGYRDGQLELTASSEEYDVPHSLVPVTGFWARENNGATYYDNVDIKINKTPRESPGWRPAGEPVEIDDTPALDYQSTLPQTGMSNVFLAHTDNPSQVVYSFRSWDRKVYRYDLDTESQVWDYQFSSSSSSSGRPDGMDFRTYDGGEYICWGGRFDDDNRGVALLDVTNDNPSQEFRYAPFSSWTTYGTTFSTSGQFFSWGRGSGTWYTFDHSGLQDSESESGWRASSQDWQNDDLIVINKDDGARIRNIDSSGNIGSTVFHDSNGGRHQDGERGVALHPSDSIVFYWRDNGSTLRMYDFGSSSEIDTLSTESSGNVECVEQGGRTIVGVFEDDTSGGSQNTVYEYDGGWNEIMTVQGSGEEHREGALDLNVVGDDVYWTAVTEDTGDWTVEVWRV